MRVMLLISSLRGGGAERAAATLSRLWSDSGHTVRVTTFGTAQSDFYRLDARVTRGELDVERLSKSLFGTIANTVRRARATRREIKSFDPDVVVAFMPSANVLAAVSAIGLRARVVGCERSHPPQMPMGLAREFARSRLYGLLDAVAALTTETAEWLQRRTHARSVRVIPNVVTLPLDRTSPHVSPGVVCAPGRMIVLAVGRLSPEKGFGELIDAFSAVQAQNPKWDLVVLGEGPCRDELQSKIAELGLEKRVMLPGRVGNVDEWYERASLYAMSSHYEGFPNALAEAMAHGLPAVSYDCDTGPRDIVRNGIDGILVPSRDIGRLATAMSSLMSDDDLRTLYALRATDVVIRFSANSITSMWNKLFEDVLGR